MKITVCGDNLIIEELKDFDLEQTIECGQCFHFVKLSDYNYGIVHRDRLLNIEQKDGRVVMYNTSREDYDEVWREYFDIDRDYAAIKKHFLEADDKLKEAIEMMWGIRLLKQDFFETLISFIISQNKQIPHIKQIVDTISREYGSYLGEIEGHRFYSFPDVERLYQVTEDELRACRTGFRAPYIRCAVNMVYNREIDCNRMKEMDVDTCRDYLMQIKGVGTKVANCVMLFGLSKRSAFPVDVWIKRIMEYLYYDGKETSKDEIEAFATAHFGELGGYAQQYLFYYGKSIKVGASKLTK